MSDMSSLHRLCADAPERYGLLITYDSSSSSCRTEFVPDEHLDDVHPNAYGPATLRDLSCLGGGGSGVRVFRGFDPQLGSLVMKHGGHKDTKELFALTTIAQELQKRNNPVAAKYMQSRIPEFRMIYISPNHIRDTPKELWKLLSKVMYAIIHTYDYGDDFVYTDHSVHSIGSESSIASSNSSGENGTSEHEKQILLFASSTEDKVGMAVHHNRLEMVLGCDKIIRKDRERALCYGTPGDGFPCFKRFVSKLIPFQEKRLMKFTLGQKTIGGPGVRTGFSYLAKGELHGELLETLIREYVHVIRNLQQLTLPQEEDTVEQVRKEVARIEKDVFARPVDISDQANAFVGFSIKKNYHPNMGRFFLLRRLGKEFRSKSVILTKEEKLPARLLGISLRTGAVMSDVFDSAPNITMALDFKSRDGSRDKYDTWRALLRDAVSLKGSAALKCIWSCGIADGGLHNLFLSSDKIWFFDLGEPTLQPLPAFLTKLLFSFLHSLGMVDDEVNGGWVNRFVPGDKLKLTRETKMLVPKAYDALKVTMDRIIEELFDGEEEVRGLLINYSTLQLLSDAAFCLHCWTVKGGGRPQGSNHNRNLEKWLWRALWDIYIANDLNTKRRLNQLCEYEA
jgi:hypothetical protein